MGHFVLGRSLLQLHRRNGGAKWASNPRWAAAPDTTHQVAESFGGRHPNPFTRGLVEVAECIHPQQLDLRQPGMNL